MAAVRGEAEWDGAARVDEEWLKREELLGAEWLVSAREVWGGRALARAIREFLEPEEALREREARRALAPSGE